MSPKTRVCVFHEKNNLILHKACYPVIDVGESERDQRATKRNREHKRERETECMNMHVVPTTLIPAVIVHLPPLFLSS